MKEDQCLSLIERCDKCGKAFMDKSEVKRHKMYEHIVPVSPFEEVKEQEDNREGKSPHENMEEIKTNEPDNIKSLGQLQSSKTSATPADVNTTKGIDDNNNNTDNSNYNKANDNNTAIGNRLRSFRSFRL
jgi:hypothetical protein